MKLIIIITRDNKEFEDFWGFKERENELQQEKLCSQDKTIILIKPVKGFSIENGINKTSDYLIKLCEDKITSVGVIFHEAGGATNANSLKAKLKESLKDKLAFCEWYSSTKPDFWNENQTHADLPYNNLKKAWKDNQGDKAKSFESVWKFFLGDISEESKIEKTKIKLLHQCLDPSKLKDIKVPVSLKADFDRFKNNFIDVIPSTFDDRYVNALLKLRNKWLDNN